MSHKFEKRCEARQSEIRAGSVLAHVTKRIAAITPPRALVVLRFLLNSTEETDCFWPNPTTLCYLTNYIRSAETGEIFGLIRYNLRQEDFEVTGVAAGPKALKAIKRRTPILILLDLMLPGISGLELCRTLKDSPTNRDIPIIMITAKSEAVDVVKGLDYGADDYITKPFSPKVMVARVKALLRRQSVNRPNESEVLSYKDLTIHPGRFEVIADGLVLNLTHTEFLILHFLARRPGWVYTRYQIIDGVRGRDYIVTDRSVDVTIVSLRKKLGDRSDCIRTVRGVGYKFIKPA